MSLSLISNLYSEMRKVVRSGAPVVRGRRGELDDEAGPGGKHGRRTDDQDEEPLPGAPGADGRDHLGGGKIR